MTTEIGFLKKLPDDEGNKAIYRGEVKLARRLNGYIALYTNPRWTPETGDKTPRYRIGYKPYRWRDGEYMIGSAWEKYAEETETDFLSLSLDDPDWNSPLNLAAFPRDNGDDDEADEGMNVVWSRPRRNEEKEAA